MQNDLVRVCVNNQQRDGKILSRNADKVLVGIGEPHYFNYEEKEFSLDEIKRFYPISVDATANASKILLSEGFEHIKKLLQNLLPSEVAEVKDDTIVGYHGSVTLETVIMEVARIGGIQEVAGFQVTIWRSHPATFHEPEYVSDYVVDVYRSLPEAASVFVQTIFKCKCDDYCNSLDDMLVVL